jgi:hypothetical protein
MGLLQHAFPSGFMKVRYYGFLSPTSSVPLEEVRAKVELASGFQISATPIELPAFKPPVCRACGGRLGFVRSFRVRPARPSAPRPEASPPEAPPMAL